MSKEERVKIWNTYFKLTWEEAQLLHDTTSKKKTQKRSFNPAGGCLTLAEFHNLATIVLCNLAIEARANHLIAELEEKGIISKEMAYAAMRLPSDKKWFLLPELAKTDETLTSSTMPHQAIREICRLRNDFIHVNFTKLTDKLPTSRKTLTLFKNFIAAMENMNVILKRIKKERKKVLNIGEF
jgi:hypothetical protein